jgi:lipid-A-disaccharide synthase
MTEALRLIRESKPNARAVMVLSERMAERARELGLPREIEVQSSLADGLAGADVAIAKSGTVTLECAYFEVPTVVMYKMSVATYAIAKCIVQVKWAAMPNILANEEVLPEFVQNKATPANIARAALELLDNGTRRNTVKVKLRSIAASLGAPGASRRAAEEIIKLLSQ